jgi:hypothetical protein
LPIFDCRLKGEEVAAPLLQSTIGNQQSAMKTWSLAGGAYMPRRDRVCHPRRLLRVFRESSHFFKD